jgi:dihydrofolate reductase
MSPIVVQAFITLDGVVQGGGGPDEDREGGFEQGGWATDYDAEHGGDDDGIVAEWESKTEALLLGRKTYEIFAGSWGVWDENAEGLPGELTRRYNRIPKYVASHTLTKVDWQNAQLVG